MMEQLLKKLNFALMLFFLIFLSALHLPSFTQNNFGKKISFSANDEKLSSALARLSVYENVNFTYNASDPSFDKTITYSTSNKNIEAILSDILSQTNHEYRLVGNQYVIVLSDKKPQQQTTFNAGKQSAKSSSTTSSLATNLSVPDTIIKLIEIPITIRDTVRIVDIITKIDTIRILDTVFIKMPSTPLRNSRLASRLKDVFRFEPDREDGWMFSFSYSQLLAGYSSSNAESQSPALKKVNNAETISARNFALNSAIQLNKGKFKFLAGVQLAGFSNRFSYANITINGGGFALDTLDAFYTIIDDVPVYTYITDSTWIPLDREELYYDQFNQIGLLEMQLGLGYTLYANEDISLFINGAFNLGIPLYLEGSVIKDVEGYPAVELNKELFAKWTYSWQAGFGSAYRLSNWVDLCGELYYKRYTNQIVPNFSIDRNLHGVGLKLGVLYYF
jgi:hypothetical protein